MGRYVEPYMHVSVYKYTYACLGNNITSLIMNLHNDIGTGLDKLLLLPYHFFNKSLTWFETRLYCRENYTELAHAEDTIEMNQLKNTVLAAGYNSKVWINLYTHIYNSAKDYSEDYLSRENQKDETAPFFVRFFCGSVSLNGLSWNNNCSVERPFICYNGEYKPEPCICFGE
uniref:C-type lectin domain-containing protein n=1 Tax=Amphilophus citrinellus TaxID=61819 RepID=A0A3Q0S1L8_AMPCI